MPWRRAGGRAWVSPHEAALVLGLFLAPAWGVLAAQVSGVLLATAAVGPRRPRMVLRRLRNLVFATCVGIAVFNFALAFGSAHGWAGLVAATLAAVGAALAMYWLTSPSPVRDQVQPVVALTAVAGTAASIAIALAALELLRDSKGPPSCSSSRSCSRASCCTRTSTSGDGTTISVRSTHRCDWPRATRGEVRACPS